MHLAVISQCGLGHGEIKKKFLPGPVTPSVCESRVGNLLVFLTTINYIIAICCARNGIPTVRVLAVSTF